jgi:putative SOS response-associated peptidase YedK
MIDRYSIAASRDQLEKRFGVDVPPHFKPRYNCAPTQLLPVITGIDPNGISTFYWGMHPSFAKQKTLSERIINQRAEQITEKPALKKILMQHRCIIPADGFFGWKKVGKKTMVPYRFTLSDNKLFSFAGIWAEFENEQDEEIHTFSIITMPANESVLPVQERMPLLFTTEQEKLWLDNETPEQQLMELLKTYYKEELINYTVSSGITDIKNDFASLLKPAPAGDQHGNLTLFD